MVDWAHNTNQLTNLLVALQWFASFVVVFLLLLLFVFACDFHPIVYGLFIVTVFVVVVVDYSLLTFSGLRSLGETCQRRLGTQKWWKRSVCYLWGLTTGSLTGCQIFRQTAVSTCRRNTACFQSEQLRIIFFVSLKNQLPNLIEKFALNQAGWPIVHMWQKL